MDDKDKKLKELADQIASFEAGATQRGRTTGEAEGGRSFEALVKGALAELVFCLASWNGLELGVIKRESGDRKIAVFLGNPRKGRYMVWGLPGFADALDDVVKRLKEKPSCCGIAYVNENLDEDLAVRISDWTRREYEVAHWYDPKLPELWRKGWIPEESETRLPYRAGRYREIYSGKTTEFDGAILKLVSPPSSGLEKVHLDKKILVEIKSAKSSRGNTIDGNAHERFSFQNMEYLEIASLYPKTQLLLLTNDVFLRSRNKYHTAFGVHAVRLMNAFCFYEFDMVSTSEQYVRLFKKWEKWLLS